MNSKFLVFLFLFISFNLSAQKDTISNSEKEFEILENLSESQEIDKDEKIYIHVEQMPEFPGGITELRRYIAYNVEYPLYAREKGIQGTVYLRFEVEKDGSIGEVEIQKGVHKLLDKASIKVIRKLPQFKPGVNNGKPVSVWFSIPITFKTSMINLN